MRVTLSNVVIDTYTNAGKEFENCATPVSLSSERSNAQGEDAYQPDDRPHSNLRSAEEEGRLACIIRDDSRGVCSPRHNHIWICHRSRFHRCYRVWWRLVVERNCAPHIGSLSASRAEEA